ncbi:ferritin family protein [Salipaludibacillus aurantiacus]|uniref:Rubrerythrin n=1 Tax=Salipaludibacillus aurantiacus TaxID=1601833 RepID=A0A1H9UPY7_9BACI|nr:Rubrerythrin [Salipaludibacillus aurantiacus]
MDFSYYYNGLPYEKDHFRTANNDQLVNDIQKAINGEYSAVACYEQIAEMAPEQNIRNKIMEIRQDEIRHYEEFVKIYTSLTGRQPTAKITEECPDTYREGLDVAFKDEQETVDFYLDIADKVHDSSIREIFRRAAADEQNHAVWFLYFSGKQKEVEPQRHSKRQDIETYGALGALNAAELTLPEILTYAIQDEYLAQARYDDVLGNFGYVRTFAQIKEAEMRHINALLTLFERYQVPVPENNASLFVSTPGTLKDAYAAGVQGEIDNIAMYEKFLSYDLPPDLRTVFTQLRNASRNHLVAFERGLARG